MFKSLDHLNDEAARFVSRHPWKAKAIEHHAIDTYAEKQLSIAAMDD
jgi:hypothetical protein